MKLPFVGRQREVAMLAAEALAAAGGTGSFITITGEPGIGKSRLAREFASSESHGTVLTSSAAEDAQEPFSLWQPIIATALRRASPSRSGQPQQLRPPTEVLPQALPAADDADSPGPQDMAGVADRLLTVLDDLNQPAVIILEDLQWADKASLRLLAHLVPVITAESILIVATIRTSLSGELPAGLPAAASQIALGGLPANAVREALSDLYPDSSLNEIDNAAQTLTSITGGNPLAALGLLVNLERAQGSEPLLARLNDQAVLDMRPPAVLADAIDAMLAQLEPGPRAILAIACIAGTFEPITVAQLAGTTADAVNEALRQGSELWILDATTAPITIAHPLLCRGLIDGLPSERACAVHAELFRELSRGTPQDWSSAVRHGQQSGGLVSSAELSRLADLAGGRAISELAYEDADRLLAIGEQYSPQAAGEATGVRAERTLLRATAKQRIGQMDAAYELYRTAASLAETSGNQRILAQSAIGYAFPPDWRAGSTEALELLEHAERKAGSGPDSVKLAALRSMLEMRIPQPSDDGQQWSWVVRAHIAQPRAQAALDAARELQDQSALLMALLAWRSTHRAPIFLPQRIAATREAVDLATTLNESDQLLEACVRLTVDALESADRNTAEEATSIAVWAANRNHDQRLLWRAHGLQAQLASLDRDWDKFDFHREQGRIAGEAAGAPGTFVMHATQGAQRCVEMHDIDTYRLVFGSLNMAIPAHPLGAATVALAVAGLERPDQAKHMIKQTISLLDDESSLLQTLAVVGRAAALIQDTDSAAELLPMMTPWIDRVAVDAEAIMCAGPLATVIADLAMLVGELPLHSEAEAIARNRGNELARGVISTDIQSQQIRLQRHKLLTSRETAILREIAAGRTNSEIAERLNFSLATVRRDSISIYDKLGVRGRAAAASRGIELKLLGP